MMEGIQSTGGAGDLPANTGDGTQREQHAIGERPVVTVSSLEHAYIERGVFSRQGGSPQVRFPPDFRTRLDDGKEIEVPIPTVHTRDLSQDSQREVVRVLNNASLEHQRRGVAEKPRQFGGHQVTYLTWASDAQGGDPTLKVTVAIHHSRSQVLQCTVVDKLAPREPPLEVFFQPGARPPVLHMAPLPDASLQPSNLPVADLSPDQRAAALAFKQAADQIAVDLGYPTCSAPDVPPPRMSGPQMHAAADNPALPAASKSAVLLSLQPALNAWAYPLQIDPSQGRIDSMLAQMNTWPAPVKASAAFEASVSLLQNPQHLVLGPGAVDQVLALEPLPGGEAPVTLGELALALQPLMPRTDRSGEDLLERFLAQTDQRAPDFQAAALYGLTFLIDRFAPPGGTPATTDMAELTRRFGALSADEFGSASKFAKAVMEPGPTAEPDYGRIGTNSIDGDKPRKTQSSQRKELYDAIAERASGLEPRLREPLTQRLTKMADLVTQDQAARRQAIADL